MSEFPHPSADELETSAALAALIRAGIEQAGGALPFSRYMEMCLYTPALGYYSAGRRKFGPGGDFVTAPELTPLFGRCLARSCASVLAHIDGGDVLEFGAGSGRLAVDLLEALDALDCLPRHYYILERSASLQQRQQQLLQKHLPQLAERVSWLERLPEKGFRGVMLANEVLDAMAVERFRWNGTAAELYEVAIDGESFAWRTRVQGDDAVAEHISELAQACDMAPGFVSEINPGLQPWVSALSDVLERGLLLLLDYGYPQHEYYHAQRSAGTLMCHYRQRAHADPFLWPGLQDITAHVDFTAVAAAADAAGLSVAAYTTQAWYLLDCGLEALLQETGAPGSIEYMREAQHVKTLILPGEMGERFKAIALTREPGLAIPGFRMQDMRSRL